MKSQIVEIQVTSSTLQNFFFQNQPFLVKKKITAVEILTAEDMPITPGGNTNITLADLKALVVTFYSTDPENYGQSTSPPQGEWMRQIPAVLMHRLNNGTDPFVYDLYRLFPQEIYWEKSKVSKVNSSGLAASLPAGIVFQVYYEGLESL